MALTQKKTINQFDQQSSYIRKKIEINSDHCMCIRHFLSVVLVYMEHLKQKKTKLQINDFK